MAPKVDSEFRKLISPLSEDEYEKLEQSILKDKCRDSLVIWKERQILLDGHNRLDICQKHSLRFKIIEISLANRKDARIWIRWNQLGRRNLTEDQRAIQVAALVQEIAAESKKERASKAGRVGGKIAGKGRPKGIGLLDTSANKPIDQQSKTGIRHAASKQAGISERKIRKATELLKTDPGLASKVQQGETTLRAASKEIDDKSLQRQRQKAKIEAPAIPSGTYRCIVIDPPWPVAKIEREKRPLQNRNLDYPIMTLDEIEALPIERLKHKDGCHIYLWVTQKYLREGLRFLETWGFYYQCLLTWVKPTGMTPFSWMYNTEHVIYGHYGGLKLKKLGIKLSFSAAVKKGSHSTKPDIFYDLVSQASSGPRLEMFARQSRKNFKSWGNEIL